MQNPAWSRPTRTPEKLRKVRLFIYLVTTAVLAASNLGCAVPQPAGLGKVTRVKEPRVGAWYYLYLPEAYVKNNGFYPGDAKRLWPVVVTFHGLKPWDTWDRQVHEWEQEADTYGYIVCAPYLETCDGITMEFPLRKEHGYVLRDKEAVMACLDHVLETTRGDPNAVLSTSWSSGGFMANYFPNRFPHRFRAIATRMGNFSPDILIESTVPLYRDMPVAVFIGDSDFNACIKQSKQQVAWYKARGFNHVEAKILDGTGHRRVPQLAASFFARCLNIEPLKPEAAAATLAQLHMTDWEPDAALLASVAPPKPVPGGASPAVAAKPAPKPIPHKESPGAAKPMTLVSGTTPPRSSIVMNPRAEPPLMDASRGSPITVRQASPPRDAVVTRAPTKSTDSNRNRPAQPTGRSHDATPGVRATGPRETAKVDAPPPPAVAGRSVSGASTFGDGRLSRTVGIRLGGPSIGVGSMYVAFSTDLPTDLQDGADFLWTNNGVPISDAPRGVKLFDTPGTHRLAVLIITRDGREYRGSTTITVREPKTARASGRTGDVAAARLAP